VKKLLSELGVPDNVTDTALLVSKVALRRNRHIVTRGTSYSWSDVPVDPWVHLRNLPPHDALDRLLELPSRAKPEERDALEDAIRASLPARG
jgi:hypothetical protein